MISLKVLDIKRNTLISLCNVSARIPPSIHNVNIVAVLLRLVN